MKDARKSEFGFLHGREAHLARANSIDLGLALLSIARIPGESLTQEDIAAWCGCARGYIHLIEKRAIKKLRIRLHYMKTTDPRLAELVESIFWDRHPAERREVA